MHRIVYGAFKAIFMSVLFIVIWDIVFFLMRAEMLNQRIESTMVTMQQEVARNNYLPTDSYKMYKGILVGIANDMNGDKPGSFVNGYNINYKHECNADYSNAMKTAGLTPVKRLDTPGNYGDVAVIELQVSVNALSFSYMPEFDATTGDRNYDGDANKTRHYTVQRIYTYTYQVPCLRYISVTK